MISSVSLEPIMVCLPLPTPSDVSSEDAGVRRSDVVDWYLLQKEADIETEVQLLELKELVEKVLDRLIYKVSVMSSVF